MERVVLFTHTSPLLLENVQRTPDGSVAAGLVVNGGWQLEIHRDECQAKGGSGVVVSRWPKPADMQEVIVSDNWRGDYNTIIMRAQRALQPTKEK